MKRERFELIAPPKEVFDLQTSIILMFEVQVMPSFHRTEHTDRAVRRGGGACNAVYCPPP